MFLSNLSISRPVLATMMSAVIVVFGLVSLPKLGIETYPNIDFPVVSVYIALPGADPETVEQQIIEPMERAVNGINGLEQINSTSFAGAGLIVLQFKLEKKSEVVAQDVRDRVFAAIGQLPGEAKTPIIQKADIGLESIVDLALSSKTLSIAAISQLSKDKILPRLERVDGVAKIDALGQRLREIHVLVERNRLSSYGLSVADVANSVRAQAIDIPAGEIKTESGYFPIRVSSKLHSVEDIRALPVVNSNGAQVQVGDVADVQDTIAFEETASFYNGNSTILFSVSKQAGANVTGIADGVREVVEKLKTELPSDVELSIVSDNSRFIRGSIEAVQLDLFLGALLAILTVLVFLRNFRATLISAIALPTAVIGTFAFLNFMGFTLNFMSMLGLSLSIGILIDDAIVVIENIYRHLHMGKPPLQAARDATSEIGLAVMATTMTICAVFVPVAFMEGIIGRFFYQFGLTVAFAVLISLFVAFTLTPMLSSRFLSEQGEAHTSRFYITLERAFVATENRYRSLLAWALKWPISTVLIGLGLFVFSLFLLTKIDVAFFPNEDQGQFRVQVKLPENTPISVTKSEALQMSAKLQAYPGVKSVVATVAGGNDRSPNAISLNVNLVTKNERNYRQDEIIQRVRNDFLRDYEKPRYEIDIGGNEGKNLVFVLQSDNVRELEEFGVKLSTFIKEKIEGSVDVSTSKAKSRKEMALFPRLALSNDLGVTPIVAANQTRTMFEGEKVGQIDSESKRFDVLVRLSEGDRRFREDIESVTLKTSKGNDVPLMSAVRVEEHEAPTQVARYNGQRQLTVAANYLNKDITVVTAKVQEFIAKEAPASVKMSLSGEAEILGESVAAMMSALLLAVLLIYMILCVQYERYIAPFVIMAALPLSFTGAFGAILLANEYITVYTMIGLILLMGIVTKNGILLIDFTLHKMTEGLSVHDALMEAGPVRLRPILMTTFAAGFGMVPVAIGHGEGGEAKASMGIAVIGGLIASTLLTLVIVPCLFALAERMRGRKFLSRLLRYVLVKIFAKQGV